MLQCIILLNYYMSGIIYHLSMSNKSMWPFIFTTNKMFFLHFEQTYPLYHYAHLVTAYDLPTYPNLNLIAYNRTTNLDI